MVPGGDDLTVEEGAWDVDDVIRERFNAGEDPEDIGKEIGRDRAYVCRRLTALRKWGEVQPRKGGLWTNPSCCDLPESERACGVKKPTYRSNTCHGCSHLGKVKGKEAL